MKRSDGIWQLKFDLANKAKEEAYEQELRWVRIAHEFQGRIEALEVVLNSAMMDLRGGDMGSQDQKDLAEDLRIALAGGEPKP